MSLVDRSFEEVCSIMDRTGDVVELLVEHAADFRMCDLLDDGTSMNPGSSSCPSSNTNTRKSEDQSTGLAPGNAFKFYFLNTKTEKKKLTTNNEKKNRMNRRIFYNEQSVNFE